MSRKRNNKKPYYAFESLASGSDHKYTSKTGKTETDTTTNLCYSMLVSSAFLDLTPRQRMLYVYAKTQFYGAHSRPSKDFKDDERFTDNSTFYLNHALVTEIFGLYPKTNRRDFYADIQSLISHGFIQLVSSGKGNKQRSIYRYSTDWKDWNPK